MVDPLTEAKSSNGGVTNPYHRTEHCDNMHGYRCDKEVGILGIDISKDHLVTSEGRVYENNKKGYEEILKVKLNTIVVEPTGAYSIKPCQYFKEKGIKILQVSPNILWKEKDLRGKKTDFYDAQKLINMANKAKEYNYNPLKELVTLYVFLKDLEVKYKNRVKRALFLVSDEEKISKEMLEEFSKGNFKIQLYNLEYTKIVLEEIEVLSKALLETSEKIKEVEKMIQSQSENHVLLTIPGIGKLSSGIIIGIVGDIKRFPNPESFVAYCGLDPIVERSGKATVSKGISKKGNKYLRSLFYFLAEMNYSRNPTLLEFYENHKEKLKGKKLYTALARKLARIVWSVWYNNKPYEPK
ncbi:IS110 family transposase [Acidianus brierleyi]|uniref:IS110 family transposase n=1 Tax=Acidianus brierleyi TaxID=41673 RepID=A0A2U9IGZ4_9CREN|nr:IS110 family transposase [Acidianus brierleyi]AWR95270.1 IS110 family transposase [Acidianus brierleyi]